MHVLDEDAEERSACILLVGLQTRVAIMGNRIEVPQQTKSRTPMWSKNPCAWSWLLGVKEVQGGTGIPTQALGAFSSDWWGKKVQMKHYPAGSTELIRN
jgi:hypothetical protein